MNNIIEKFNKIHITISGVFLSIFFVTVVIQVVSRLLFRVLPLVFPNIAPVSMIWTEDVTMYSFIWSVFLGASAMIYPEKHFAFTSISDNIKSKKAKITIHLVIMALVLLFMILMIYYGCIVTKKFWNYRGTSLPQLKRGWTWLCLPVSGACGCIYLIQKIVLDIRKLTKKEDTN